LARDIHDRLHVDTLEALEAAAHDGSLLTVPGIGERRAAAIRAGLAAALGRGQARRRGHGPLPAARLLLKIDAEYRKKAAADQLPKITRAHDLGRTHDWVVIYFYDDDHRESQCTVVTETHGPMTGKRVVRGREAECRRLALAS
jgi:hypothetical protein